MQQQQKMMMTMEANTTRHRFRRPSRTTYRMIISVVVGVVLLCTSMYLLPVAATAESESASSSNKAKKVVIPENSDSGAGADPSELFQNSGIIVVEEEEAKSKMDADADANALLLAEEELLADEIAKETIEAGRGHRDERGVRDQWESDEHLTSESISRFDTRKGRPISNDVKRLLKQYRLDCIDCDHNDAVQKVNKYVRETKRLTKLEKEQKEKYDIWSHRIFTAIIMIGLSLSYIYQKEILTTLLGDDYETRIRRMVTSGIGGGGNGNGDLSGFTEVQRTEIMRLRRQHASDAATKRQRLETNTAVQPTWLDNEKKEIWTPKQEKQFQKAYREYSGVPKKERYKLIAEKVDDKSRIECLTHHRMIELLEKQQQQQQQ